jgi:hypothetical protein
MMAATNARPAAAEAEAILAALLAEGRHTMVGRGRLVVLAIEMESSLFRRLAAWDRAQHAAGRIGA